MTKKLLVIASSLLIIVGCESDYQKCMNTEVPKSLEIISSSTKDLEEAKSNLEVWVVELESWAIQFKPLMDWIDDNPGPIDTRTVADLELEDELRQEFIQHRLAFLNYWAELHKKEGNPVVSPEELIIYSSNEVVEYYFENFNGSLHALKDEAIFDGRNPFDTLLIDDVLRESGSEQVQIAFLFELIKNAKSLIASVPALKERQSSDLIKNAQDLASDVCNSHGFYQ